MKHIITVLMVSMTAPSMAQRNQPTANQPNVVMIVVDDMKDWVGYLDGYEGKVYTPHIDKLAADGVGFTNGHTAAPVCCPSRNALLLGKYPGTTGLYNNNQWWKASRPDYVTLPQYFRQNGYYTAGAGKIFHHTPGNNPMCSWDNYQDVEFDHTWTGANWDVERFAVQYGYRGPIGEYPDWKPLNGILPIRPELDWGPIPAKPDSTYGDLRAVAYAERFLSEKHDKPFFLAVGIFRPHLPWHVPQKYFDLYPSEEIVLPERLDKDLDDVPEEGKKLARAKSKDFYQIRDENKYKDAVRAYLASISFADDQVGAVYQALQNSSFAENTIVVLWSDHGWHLGSKDHWHKTTLWEECTRIPFVIKVPGVSRKNSLCDAPVDLVNVFPTLISLCGLPKKEDLDGHDMTSIILDEMAKWEYPAITHAGQGQIAVRSREWRYIRYGDKTEELYHLKQDPLEWKNLAGNKRYQKILDEHRKWVPETFADPLPGKSRYFFDPYAYTWIDRETRVFIDGK